MLLRIVNVLVTWIGTFVKPTATFRFCNIFLFNTIVIRKKTNFPPKNGRTPTRTWRPSIILLLATACRKLVSGKLLSSLGPRRPTSPPMACLTKLTFFVSPWARETPMRNVLTSLFTKVGTWKTIENYLFEHVRQRTIQPLLCRIASWTRRRSLYLGDASSEGCQASPMCMQAGLWMYSFLTISRR